MSATSTIARLDRFVRDATPNTKTPIVQNTKHAAMWQKLASTPVRTAIKIVQPSAICVCRVRARSRAHFRRGRRGARARQRAAQGGRTTLRRSMRRCLPPFVDTTPTFGVCCSLTQRSASSRPRTRSSHELAMAAMERVRACSRTIIMLSRRPSVKSEAKR